MRDLTIDLDIRVIYLLRTGSCQIFTRLARLAAIDAEEGILSPFPSNKTLDDFFCNVYQTRAFFLQVCLLLNAQRSGSE